MSVNITMTGAVYAECDECGDMYADANGDPHYRLLDDLLEDMRADGWQENARHVRCSLHRWPQCDSCGRIARNGTGDWPEAWICPDCGRDA